MRIAIILLLITAAAQASSIGIIDRTESHFNDMAKVADCIGILVKDHADIAIAIQGLIILDVDVIAMPIQLWRYDSGIARAIASANKREIKVYGAGTNNKWYSNDIMERIHNTQVQKYIGVEYVDRTFWRSASENTVRKAVGSCQTNDR